MRKLAKIVKISDVLDIEDANNIQLAKWLGWQCVIKKNSIKKGDLALAFEIDSWIPNSIAPFLTKEGKEPKEYNGVKGERLRTIKLKGQVSQGLIIPLHKNNEDYWLPTDLGVIIEPLKEGDDITEFLNIQKWEKPIPANLVGQMKGNFPSYIFKTDQLRIQNLEQELQEWSDQEVRYEVSLKIDGSSMTIYHKDGEVGVCSRNIDLKINEENKDNAYVKMANELNIFEVLKKYRKNIAIQGELWGEGINGNWEGVKGQNFSVFDIFDIDNQKYFTSTERFAILALFELNGVKLRHVPVIENYWNINGKTIQDILTFAEGPSIHNKVREGLVFKAMDGSHSFKAINNEFLLKKGD